MTKIQILDGGMGRELNRIGAPFRQPEWSALALLEGPEFVRRAHDAFIESGARIITTNSYAVVPFHLGQERFAARGTELAALAAQIARAAADAAPGAVLVAGSLPPALGSYRPDLFDHDQSVAIHRQLIAGMTDHVDVWLAETQSSLAEVKAAAEALDGSAKPLWISYTLADDPDDVQPVPSLRSGESVADGVAAALGLGAKAILFNCSQPEVMAPALAVASAVISAQGSAVALGVYANAFPPQRKNAAANADLDELRPDVSEEAYRVWARRWADAGATIIGGCCGIGPEHIRMLAADLAT